MTRLFVVLLMRRLGPPLLQALSVSTLAMPMPVRRRSRIRPEQTPPNCGIACRNLGFRVTKQQPLARNLLCGVAHLSSCATLRRSHIAGGA
jgi:hypothetical protein